MSDSLGGAIARAMGDAAHGAAVGAAIGRANDDAQEESDRADGWMVYAKKLERKITVLESNLKTALVRADSLTLQLSQLNNALLVKTKEYDEEKKQGEAGIEYLKINRVYGNRIKGRLVQMEKALEHSSADKQSVSFILDIYKKVVEQFNLQGEIPSDLREKADAIYEKFMSGEKLTQDDGVQKILDAFPMPARPPGAVF